jgi:hypothetical protein
MKKLPVFLLLAFSASAQPGPAGDRDDPFAARNSASADAILAEGNPPLTESMAARYTSIEAWIYEIQFTQQQRDTIRARLLRDWKTPERIKSDIAFLSQISEWAQRTPDDREFIRLSIQTGAVAISRIEKDNPDAQWMLAAYEEAHQPIAPGDPPLTESMVSHFTFFLGWVLEIPLTQPLKDKLRAALLEDWKQPKEIKSDMDFLNWQLDMAEYFPEEREYVRSKAEPDIIKAMRVDWGNPAARWIVAAYDAAHPSIAAGNPPLTRQASDAYTELLCFMRNQGGGPRQEANQALKDSTAQLLAQNYSKLSPEQQQKLAQMPQKWATVRISWMRSSEAGRQKMRAQWQPAVQSSPQTDHRWDEAHEAAARYEVFLEKDASTVSQQELLRHATDCDTVAQELRREGGEKNLVYAAAWDQASRNLRAGKEAYVRQIAVQAANAAADSDMLEIMRAQHAVRALQRNVQAIQNVYMMGDVTMKNIIAIIGDSPYHYESRNK